MKNKEIEELLNKIKNSIKKHKELNLDDDMLVVLEFDVIQWNLLLSYIEQLQTTANECKQDYQRIYNENCKLREEHNITDISLLDENQQLKKQKDDVVEYIKNNTFHCKNQYEQEQYDRYLLIMLGEIE